MEEQGAAFRVSLGREDWSQALMNAFNGMSYGDVWEQGFQAEGTAGAKGLGWACAEGVD